MFKRLDEIKVKHKKLESQLSQLEHCSLDQRKEILKEYSALSKVVNLYEEYKKIEKEIIAHQNIIANEKEDKDFILLAQDELSQLTTAKDDVVLRIRKELLPKDPMNKKNAIMELRQASGGAEAALFCENLFQLYSHYAIKKGWTTEILSSAAGSSGGFREIICSVSGSSVYAYLKYESGVHRVQRVPQTESQGRVHTSTATVVVLPLVDEKDITIHPSDLRIDSFRSSGAGGQHVNTTDSAIRIVHLPTKITVQCQDEKSQHANKDRAMKVLYARLYDQQQQEQKSRESRARQSQIGTGSRCEKVRTYNFPQSRVTDHRIGLTLHNIDEVLRGDIELFIEALQKKQIEQLIE